MRITVNAPDYKDLSLWRIKRLADGLYDKEGVEELSDAAIGPDVRYVLQSNNIELVKRYLKSPVAIEEYRELRYKLQELQAQQTTVPAEEVIASTNLKLKQDCMLLPERKEQQAPGNQYYQKESIVDLVA